MTGKDFKSYLKASILVLGFAALTVLLPSPLSFIFEAFAAAYFAKTVVLNHYKYVAALGFLVLAITAAAGSVMGAALNGVIIILLGLSLGLGKRINLSYYKLLFICAFVYISGTVASLFVLKSASVDVFSLETFHAAANTTIEMFKESGYYVNPEVIDALNSYLKAIVLFMMQITPALLIIISIFCAFLVVQIFKRVMIKAGVDIRHFVPFDKMRAPRSCAVIFIVLFVLLSASFGGNIAYDAGLNVMFVLGFLLMVCGLSYFDWRLKMRGTKKSARRIMEIALIPISYMFMMMPLFALLILGMADSLFDLRKSTQKNKDE